jgi:hypothetical protein
MRLTLLGVFTVLGVVLTGVLVFVAVQDAWGTVVPEN